MWWYYFYSRQRMQRVPGKNEIANFQFIRNLISTEELRCHNSFNEKIYAAITDYLGNHLSEWKSTGFIPVADAVSIFNLIDELSGGSRFWSEEVELRVEDAVLEIQELIDSLEE